MQKSENINELAAALVQTQAMIKGAKKNKENPFHKSDYADLESTWDACREALTKNGLAVSQLLDSTETSEPSLTTILMHTSGQYIMATTKMPLAKGSPQEFGSATSYIRRYSLQSIVGITATDDDAETAEAKHREEKVKPYSPRQATRVETRAAKDVADFVPTFGKYKGQTLQSLDAYELASYVNYIESKAKEDGKALKGQVAEFVEAAHTWLKTKAEIPAVLADAVVVDSFDSLN
jgi:hypothetical protein